MSGPRLAVGLGGPQSVAVGDAGVNVAIEVGVVRLAGELDQLAAVALQGPGVAGQLPGLAPGQQQTLVGGSGSQLGVGGVQAHLVVHVPQIVALTPDHVDKAVVVVDVVGSVVIVPIQHNISDCVKLLNYISS